jgi:hypothetical protein
MPLKKTAFLLAALATVATTTTGCAINRATATVDPSVNLGSLKAMHVAKQPKDDNDIDVLIAEKLRSRGYKVTTGSEKPSAVDAVVTYIDRWRWDITMYMLELTITIRDPGNDYPLASGKSYHTSLARKSPSEMVDEVLSNIFKEAGR